MRIFICVFFLFISNYCTSQEYKEDFSNFNINISQWNGDTNNFKISQKILKFNSNSISNNLYLKSDSSIKSGICHPFLNANYWEFSLATGSYNPSSSNYVAFIIQSDTLIGKGDIKNNLWQGYYLAFGGATTEDFIYLIKKTKNNRETLTSLPIKFPNSLSDGINLKIEKSLNDTFYFYYKESFDNPTSEYINIGKFKDVNSNNFNSKYFGFFQNYSSENIERKIYIDNILVKKNSIKDDNNTIPTTPPIVILQNNYFSLFKMDSVHSILFKKFTGKGIKNNFDTGYINSNIFKFIGFSDGDSEFNDEILENDFARGINNGQSTIGGLYAFKNNDSIMLGIKPTTYDFNPGEIIIKILNNTNDTINNIDFSSILYFFNNGNTSSNINFYYSEDSSTFNEILINNIYSKEKADLLPFWEKKIVNFNFNSYILNNKNFYIKIKIENKFGTGSKDAIGFYNFNIFPSKIKDLSPPIIVENYIIEDSIFISFNENININSILNFEVKSNEKNINIKEILIKNNKSILIILNEKSNFENNYILKYEKSKNNITDNYNNLLEDLILNIINKNPIYPKFGDVIFNEIMIDEIPKINLPEYEFIELFNRTNMTINLYNTKLKINNNEFLFNIFDTIPENGYFLIINKSTIPDEFIKPNSKIKYFSNLSIPNEKFTVSLYYKNINEISFFNFNKSFYSENEKSDGGWSLEKIDKNNLCENKENWNYSINSNGGTPNEINSISKINLDKTNININKINLNGLDKLIIYFSEWSNINSISKANFTFTPNINFDLNLGTNKYVVDSIEIIFNNKLEKNKIYEMEISKIQDCANNELEKNLKFSFGLPDTACQNDLIINEILYNANDKEEFVEIYNKSNKILDLNKILYFKKEEQNKYIKFSNNQKFIFPNEYIVITKNKDYLVKLYNINDTNLIIQNELMPTLINDGGTIGLANNNAILLDTFNYNDSYHSPFIENTKGVSLERISLAENSNNKSNWTSASSFSNYATPTLQNSQYINNLENKKNKYLSTPNKIFSPNNDGKFDLLEININLPDAGYLVTIEVFDKNGTIVKTILNKEDIGITNTIRWDGSSNFYGVSLPGIYIVKLSAFNPSLNPIFEYIDCVIKLN